jgi:pimeloyl-ACP methyl ester carboxylesterase
MSAAHTTTVRLLAAAWLAMASVRAAAGSGLQTDVVFTDYAPFSSSGELVRRLLSPLAAAQVQAALTRSAEHLVEQSVDLAAERFVLYVPEQVPLAGYAVLVFIPPWQDARLPNGWAPVLERYGVVYVSAARSGNDENVMGRREPLALLGAFNVMQRYHVDPTRVYVGGFSGGSRIALRLALGYPDVFHGALLNAGSDPLGTLVPPLPSRELLQQFQESTRLVYLTGEHDATHLAMDADSMQSLRHWCVFNVDAQVTPGVAHEIAGAAALAGALHLLQAPPARVTARLASCRSDLERELAAALGKVQSQRAAGNRDAARKLLLEIDRRFGGLAAPRSLELQAALE